MRTALLRTVSHDLRSPLAAATAAISGLRAQDIQLAAADRDELLDTAEESLELVSRLAASLLDLTRLQAGARSVFPRPADLEEIIVRAVAGLGSHTRAVRVNLPSGWPVRYAPSAWNCRCGIGILANMAFGVASCQPNVGDCAAAGPPARGRVKCDLLR